MLPMLWVRVNGRSVLYVRRPLPWAYPGGGSEEPREKGGGSVAEMALSVLVNIGLAQIPH